MKPGRLASGGSPRRSNLPEADREDVIRTGRAAKSATEDNVRIESRFASIRASSDGDFI
jgi:hypothetical protein